MYNINANLVSTIEQLYDKCSSDEKQNGRMAQNNSRSKEKMSSVTYPFQHFFLERIMSDALEEHDGKVSIPGKNLTNLRIADVIDAPDEDEQELEALVESLDKTCTRSKMDIVGILTYLRRKNNILGLSEPGKKLNFLIFFYT